MIEGAIFDPVSIRHTSRRLNLRSEASSRFEKVLQQNLSMKRSTEHVTYYKNMLLVKYYKIVSAGDLGSFVTPIDITADKVNQTIGFDLSSDEIKAIFEQLDLIRNKMMIH